MDQVTYDLGGSVAYLPHEAQVFYMAPQTKIREMLEKGKVLGVVAHAPELVEAWLHENVGEPERIRGVAQEIVRADQATGGFLTAAWQSISKEERKEDGFDIARILSDADESCEILQSIVCQLHKHEALLAQNQRYRTFMDLQLKYREYRSRSKQIDHEIHQIVKRHDREDLSQHRESELRLQQLIQQEKLLQQRLDMQKFERRKGELQQLQRAKHDNAKKGNEVYRRGMATQLEIMQSQQPVEGDDKDSENTRPRHQSKAFLQAFLREIRDRARRVQVI